MVRFFISLSLILVSFQALAEPCDPGSSIVIVAPHSGATISGDVIAVRGFLCDRSGVVIVRNKTTASATVADTSPQCDGGQCVYTFATLIRNLAPGRNDLAATTPTGTLEASIEVIRTALASSE